MTAYVEREMAGAVAHALRHMPVIVLSGLRQTGKTTLLEGSPAIAPNRQYACLDDFAALAAAGPYAAHTDDLLSMYVVLPRALRLAAPRRGWGEA